MGSGSAIIISTIRKKIAVFSSQCMLNKNIMEARNFTKKLYPLNGKAATKLTNLVW
jgi:hypothetical protein